MGLALLFDQSPNDSGQVYGRARKWEQGVTGTSVFDFEKVQMDCNNDRHQPETMGESRKEPGRGLL
ncbi:hypothetical protein J27TS7_27950 [Paenibacillus dendritiformis]|nr:hypothetical protein J27TS7_27950 [Paenibacillus dendritiformis]